MLELEDKIYVPYYESGMCVYVVDKDTIRVFDDNTQTTYTDYYINSHYLKKSGYSSPQDVECIQEATISTLPMYRTDIFEIIFIGLAFIFVGYFFISKLIKTIFLGWRWS